MHVVFQVIEAGLADPFIAGAFRVIVACGVTFVLDVWTFEFSKFGPASSAVVVIPAFAPPGVASPTAISIRTKETQC